MKHTDISQLDPRRILVCQLKQIGDVLLSTPSVSLLKRRWPDAEIHFLTFDYCAPVLENNPDIDRIWALPKSYGFFNNFRYLRNVSRRKFDLAIDFQQLPRCQQAMFLCDAPVRLTYTPKAYRRWLYTHWTPPKGKYAAAMKSSVLSPLGLGWSGEPPKLCLTDGEKDWAASWYSGHGVTDGECIVTVDASHRHETHRWFPERFAEVMHRAAEKRANLRFVLLYGPGEKQVAQHVALLAKIPERCIVPKQQTSLRELAGIISRANLHFGNCSAPRHFAVALGVPSLVIVGGNGTTAWTFPSEQHQIAHLYTPCHKCNQKHCPKGTLECLDGLTSEMVLKQFLDMV